MSQKAIAWAVWAVGVLALAVAIHFVEQPALLKGFVGGLGLFCICSADLVASSVCNRRS